MAKQINLIFVKHFVTRSLFEDRLKTDLSIVDDNFYMKSSANFHDSF